MKIGINERNMLILGKNDDIVNPSRKKTVSGLDGGV